MTEDTSAACARRGGHRRLRQDGQDVCRRGGAHSAAPALRQRAMRRTTKFKVHDENNECREGDVVRMMETRPLSRRSGGASSRSENRMPPWPELKGRPTAMIQQEIQAQSSRQLRGTASSCASACSAAPPPLRPGRRYHRGLGEGGDAGRGRQEGRRRQGGRGAYGQGDVGGPTARTFALTKTPPSSSTTRATPAGPASSARWPANCGRGISCGSCPWLPKCCKRRRRDVVAKVHVKKDDLVRPQRRGQRQAGKVLEARRGRAGSWSKASTSRSAHAADPHQPARRRGRASRAQSHASNVMLVCPSCKTPTRMRRRRDGQAASCGSASGAARRSISVEKGGAKVSRLKDKYLNEVVPALQERFGYRTSCRCRSWKRS